MRIVNVTQGSEEWDAIRRGVPTASNFGNIITPAKGQLSSSWRGYAAELIAESLGVVVPPPPSFWMQWGIDTEPYAVAAYEQMTGNQLTTVGFVWPDDHERYGCSPDRLVGEEGLLEIKCPMPKTVIAYHVDAGLPDEYRSQVQGQLLITGRKWCDFFAYHPELKPFLLRVERDEKYIAAIEAALEEFCDKLAEMRESLADIGESVELPVTLDVTQTTYEAVEMDL